MKTEDTYTRRVCGVLLADVSGFSKLMGEDEVATADAVQRLQALAQEIVLEAKGQAEAFAGDSFWAIFESVTAAVGAGLAIQQHVAVEVAPGTELRFRIGIHVGDVLLRDGRVFGDALNIAARLQALAEPGTLCISDAVYRQVRTKFDAQFVDMGPQRLKNISDPIRAYRMVPREIAVPERRWARLRASRRTWLVAALLSLGAAVAFFILRSGFHGDARDPVVLRAGLAPEAAGQPVALGVMVFKGPETNPARDWRREALRDGLNARLSHLSKVKIYSKEFIDFLITRKGLSEIEAATQLGIKKMLSGSFFERDGEVRVEIHVVDVSTGVLDASYTTTSPEVDFLELPGRVAAEVIARLDLPVTAEERQALLAAPTSNADALKRLLEVETGGQTDAERKKSDSRTEGRSSLEGWYAWFAPRRALAEDGAEGAIRDLLDRYRNAIESREIEGLSRLYTEFTDDQREAQRRYLESARDLKVVIDQVDVAVAGDEAIVSYTRTDDFVDVKTGRPMHVSVRVTKSLYQSGGTWKLASGK